MEERGVSSIAVVIAIVVVIVAVAAIGGYSLLRSRAPSALLTVTAKDDPSGVLLTISHEGGEDLVNGDLTVKAIKGTTSAENINISAGTLRVGNSLQVLVNLSVNPDDVITVDIIHNLNHQKIFSNSSILVTARVAAILTIAQPEDADILDPARTVYAYAVNVNNLIYETLLTYDYNMNLIPMLAENLPTYDEAGMYYEFKLKRGVTFHCGHPFTAESVVYTINRDKNMPESKQTGSLSSVTAVEAVDNYTIRVYITVEDRFLLDWFATSSSAIVCDECAEKYGLLFGTPNGPPCGTGPFKFVEWQWGENITLGRYDNYNWGPEMYQNKGPAYLDGIVFRVVPENLQMAMLETGEVNFVTSVGADLEWIENWRDNPDITLYIGGQVGDLVYLGFNCAGEENHGYGYENGEISPGSVSKAVPLKVRQAIAYAINENRLIDLAYAGVATPATSWLADTIWGSIGYQEDMYPYNPEKARELLAEAGYPAGLELEVIHWTDPHYDIVCTELIRQLENVGITLTTVSLHYLVVEDRIRNKDYNMIIAGYNWNLADMIWWEWHTSRLPSPNRFWWGDDYTDAIIDNTWSMVDEVASTALYESQRLIAEDAAGLGLISQGFVSAWGSDVKGFRMHPIPSNWKFFDTYIVEL